MSDKNFAQAFCESFDVPKERFVDEVLKRTFYAHAKIFVFPLCAFFRLRWLDPDRQMLADLGCSTSIDGMKRLLSMMPSYYDRNWKFRHRLRVRLSSRKLINLADRLGLAKPGRARVGKADSVRLISGEKTKRVPLVEGALPVA